MGGIGIVNQGSFATFANTDCGELINVVADAVITNANPATFSKTGTIIERA